MDSLENVSTGKSTRTKSITSFVTALLLVMLAIPVASQAQANLPKLVVTAMNAGRFYGDANPQFTGTVTGLIPGDTITVTYSSVADSGSSVGDYQIVPTLNDPDNHLGRYNVVVNNGTLSVAPAPLSIVADDLSRAAGQPNPAFTGTVTGVKNGEAISATFDSAASASSQAGNYDIVPTLQDGSGKISNYAVTISHGTLTVTP
ncbi:MAG TPA: MBG domain-containing protein [Candidatus Angelobacter sp.]|nr:MBG domain-containing protein [Candidatus Angelobacter sp.]